MGLSTARRHDDLGQFLLIQPNQFALPTGVDDDVAWPIVGMCVQHCVASRTLPLHFQRHFRRRSRNPDWAAVLAAQELSDLSKRRTVNQQTPAIRTPNTFHVTHRAKHQGRIARRALNLRGLVRKNQNFDLVFHVSRSICLFVRSRVLIVSIRQGIVPGHPLFSFGPNKGQRTGKVQESGSCDACVGFQEIRRNYNAISQLFRFGYAPRILPSARLFLTSLEKNDSTTDAI